jgi:mannose-1-phosphate guanylyltransferase
MYSEKSWGTYKVIDVQDDSLTILITMKAGNKMHYHSHDNRNEVWTIISGTGKTVVDGMEQIVNPGDVITIEAGCKHTIIAETELKVIEVQLGKEISVSDKHKYDYDE